MGRGNQPPINLSLLYSYLTHVRQLGPSWGLNKKEERDRVGKRLDVAAFFFCFQKKIMASRDQIQSPFNEKGVERKSKNIKEKKPEGKGIAWIT